MEFESGNHGYRVFRLKKVFKLSGEVKKKLS